MAKLDIWNGKQGEDKIAKMEPDIKVFTLRLHIGESNILCGYAGTKKADLDDHFWLEKPPEGSTAELLSMTIYEYIKASFEEDRGMNPFWTLGRMEFMEKWSRLHEDKIKEIR